VNATNTSARSGEAVHANHILHHPASVPARSQLAPCFAFVTLAVARAPRAMSVTPLIFTGWTTVKLTAVPSSTSADETVKVDSTSNGVPSGIVISVSTVRGSLVEAAEVAPSLTVGLLPRSAVAQSLTTWSIKVEAKSSLGSLLLIR
jgi:hypothetical protein